jgi:DNA adenine methylase
VNYSVPTFIKWAGGKQSLLPQIAPHLPNEPENYVEPFVGGGSVLLFVLKYRRPKKAYAYDINPELINTYIQIRDHVGTLLNFLTQIQQDHNTADDQKEFFYLRRTEYNHLLKNRKKTTVQNLRRAALFLYLNKTCFNGLYRVNASGEFNVPFNNAKKIEFDCKIIIEAHELIATTEFQVADYKNAEYPSNCAAYFDPPYWPEDNKPGFVNYANPPFTEEDQVQLAGLFADLVDKGATVLLSNSNSTRIQELYFEKATFIHIYARRMINCDGKGRNKITELLLVNKPIQRRLPNAIYNTRSMPKMR